MRPWSMNPRSFPSRNHTSSHFDPLILYLLLFIISVCPSSRSLFKGEDFLCLISCSLECFGTFLNCKCWCTQNSAVHHPNQFFIRGVTTGTEGDIYRAVLRSVLLSSRSWGAQTKKHLQDNIALLQPRGPSKNQSCGLSQLSRRIHADSSWRPKTSKCCTIWR